jgi:hypothetical protein
VSARLTFLHVKVAHTAIFWFLSACVAYTLYSAAADRVTWLTWAAAGFVLVESVVLVAFGWVCPLTLLAERLGAPRGSVADIFLPKWLADRIFPICGTTYLIACLLLAARALRS